MNDLISRSAAIKAFSVYNGKHIPEVDCDNMPVEISIKQVKDTLRSLPSADRPQGKWVVKHRSHEFMRPSWCVCNQCGGAGDIGDNYCKHCGAKMKGETDDNK